MHLRDCNQCFMPFAEAACRVGVRSVGSQLERLTPASSEVSSLSFAVTAWIFHPGISTKAIEGERVAPYPIKTMSSDHIELHAGNDGGGMARGPSLPGR
jgi:hypothetical protein